jgi:hypothetical protein
MDVGDDITDYVQWKIESLCAQVDDEIGGKKSIKNKKIMKKEINLDFETEKFKHQTKKFHKIFNMPTDEKLVICTYYTSK